jgi:hypothetical protein
MESKVHKYRSSLIAAAVCVISLAGTIASKWVATDLEPKIATYRWVAYVIVGISLIVSIVLAVRAAAEPAAAGATSIRKVSIGGSANNSTNTAGDNNTINSSRNR